MALVRWILSFVLQAGLLLATWYLLFSSPMSKPAILELYGLLLLVVVALLVIKVWVIAARMLYLDSEGPLPRLGWILFSFEGGTVTIAFIISMVSLVALALISQWLPEGWQGHVHLMSTLIVVLGVLGVLTELARAREGQRREDEKSAHAQRGE